jgi:hypothetical protein
MLTTTLKVVFNATEQEDATSNSRVDKAIVAIVGRPVNACGWYGGMRELMWSNIPFDEAATFSAKIAETIDAPCSVEMTTSDPEKWANTSFSNAENLLTYKAVRNAVKSGDLVFSTEGSPVGDTEDYQPGVTDPPSDQHPVS